MIAPAIITLLKADTAVVAAVANRIYPIIDVPEVAENTALSAIYYSVSMVPEYTKNGPVAINHTVTLLVVANLYLTSWQISLLIRKALEMKTGTILPGVDFRINRCTSIDDEYEFVPDQMYGQRIVFRIRTADY